MRMRRRQQWRLKNRLDESNDSVKAQQFLFPHSQSYQHGQQQQHQQLPVAPSPHGPVSAAGSASQSSGSQRNVLMSVLGIHGTSFLVATLIQYSMVCIIIVTGYMLFPIRVDYHHSEHAGICSVICTAVLPKQPVLLFGQFVWWTRNPLVI